MDRHKEGKFGMFKDPGRRSSFSFKHTVSPLGEDMAETPTYSPSKTVEGAKMTNRGQGSHSESAKNERRGG